MFPWYSFSKSFSKTLTDPELYFANRNLLLKENFEDFQYYQRLNLVFSFGKGVE